MPTVATPDHQAHGFISFIIETQAINEASINKYILAAKKASLSLVNYLVINNIITYRYLLILIFIIIFKYRLINNFSKKGFSWFLSEKIGKNGSDFLS